MSAHICLFGGSSTIGQSTAAMLLERDCRVTIGCRHPEKVTIQHPKLTVNNVNPADFDATLAFLEGCHATSPVTGVGNFAGSLFLKAAHQTSFEQYQSVIEANLTTAFSVVRAAGQVMRAQGGQIILMSSAAGSIGLANHEAIASAKAAIQGLVRSAAATYAGQHIAINAIAPGLVETQMTASMLKSDVARQISNQMHPLGRVGRTDDVAGLAAWLLATPDTWITGQTLHIDGGLSTVKPKQKA